MNKQAEENKSIKKWLLIGTAIVLVILISYFTLTDVPLSDSDSLNKTLLKKKHTGNTYNWENLLLLLFGTSLLSILYLVVTNRLREMSRKLVTIYTAFTNQITLSEGIVKVFIIPPTIIALFIIIVGLTYNCCGWWATLSTQLYERLPHPQEPLNFRNIFIGIAGVATLVFAGWRTYIANQSRILDKGRRFDERFDSAAKALSKDLNESSFPAHLGAISSLCALAVDSSKDTQRCLDIICSCNQWMEGYIDEFFRGKGNKPYSLWLLKEDNRIANKNNGGEITLLHEKRSQEALVAISYILEEISAKRHEQLKELNFYNKVLCRISLNDIKLDDINFENTNLIAASLDRASLKQAQFSGANLKGASLWDTNLEVANLEVANLEGANLLSSNLGGAYLWGANLEAANLGAANLEGSNLEGANLEGTNLEGANLEEAQLINTQLQGAKMDNVDLSNAILLNCNLYGATLKEINSQNIMFNNIADIGYIKNKNARKKWLGDICQHIEAYAVKSFIQQMETAWQAMDNNQEPDGLDIIKRNSIVTKDSKGMYDISDEHLSRLQLKLQKIVNGLGLEFLHRMWLSIASLNETTDKNFNLVDKLQKLVEKLIEKNKNKKNK